MTDGIDAIIQALAESCTISHPTPRPRKQDRQDIMAAPQISVRDYLDLIPKFDGEATQLSTFLNACETVLQLMAPEGEIARIAFTLMHIRTKLVGKAAIMLSARPFHSFNELKETLISLFGDQRNEESLLRDLSMLRQRQNETALQFADRCIDLRCLLLNKLDCSNISNEIKAAKRELYNATALRSYLAGLNAHMSHLLRCKSPATIEEATRMVIDEENMNYHRAQLSHPPGPSKPSPNSTSHQLRINHMPVRNPPAQQPPLTQWRSHAQPPAQPTWVQRPFHAQPPAQPTWVQRPFPPPQQHLFRPNQRPMVQQTWSKPPTNVFAPQNRRQFPKPTPMDTSSGNSRINPAPPNRKVTEELYHQEEIEHPSPEENAYEQQEEEYYYNPYEVEYQEADENFITPASEPQWNS